MQYFMKKLKVIGLLIPSILMGEAGGSEIHENQANEPRKLSLYSRYSDFTTLSTDEYIRACMPKLAEDKPGAEAGKRLLTAHTIYTRLCEGMQSPIKEDDQEASFNNLEKILSEGGYSFPPRKEIQGPFLYYCGNGPKKRVLDIGAGNGSDTLPLLMTHNVQVIAVDIHERQLKELKAFVLEKFKDIFPELTTSNKFGAFTRNFADQTAEVPQKYKNKFEAVNLSRVLHFLNGEQTKTMLSNIATMMKEGGLLSLTVSTIKPGSKEEKWIDSQKNLGLENPGLVYYDTIKRIRKHPILGRQDYALPGEVNLVDRKECQLPDPGHKIEFAMETAAVNSVPAIIHTLRQGRHYHTLESIKPFLDPYFVIKDHTIYDYDGEDIFLALIAERK
ncbi:hypothetical protein IM40_00985 [Candidatus Paracaedimonas acanthamoebae]|nr:hypothetical protein IM40_00985 [Candidatus Paracaedimonas acanthamoebae]